MSEYTAAKRGASCLIIPDNSHLPVGEIPDVEAVRRRTWTGQAAWATGAYLCCACGYWKDAGGKWGKSKNARACQRYSNLMGHRGLRVPADAPSCQFFEPNEAERERQALASTFGWRP